MSESWQALKLTESDLTELAAAIAPLVAPLTYRTFADAFAKYIELLNEGVPAAEAHARVASNFPDPNLEELEMLLGTVVSVRWSGGEA